MSVSQKLIAAVKEWLAQFINITGRAVLAHFLRSSCSRKAIIFYNLPSEDNSNKIIFLRVLCDSHRASSHTHTYIGKTARRRARKKGEWFITNTWQGDIISLRGLQEIKRRWKIYKFRVRERERRKKREEKACETGVCGWVSEWVRGRLLLQVIKAHAL